MPKPLYIAVDLGGTNLRIAILDSEAHILELEKIPSDRVRSGNDLIAVLAESCHRLGARHEGIAGLSLGIPGLVDGTAGIVLQSPHFPQWKNVPLVAELKKHLSYPIVMDNDANQAALGEAWKGAGRNWKSFVLITLGTGIGGGIIIDGELFRGPTGFAGEIGHIVVDRNNLAGELGSRGTLESLASQSGLRAQLREMQKSEFELDDALRSLNAEDPALPERLFELTKSGNKNAAKIWREFGEALGCGIASLGHTLGIFNFVIGGGLAAAWEAFSKPCLDESRKRSYSSLKESVKMAPAQLGDTAGLVGGIRRLRKTEATSR